MGIIYILAYVIVLLVCIMPISFLFKKSKGKTEASGESSATQLDKGNSDKTKNKQLTTGKLAAICFFIYFPLVLLCSLIISAFCVIAEIDGDSYSSIAIRSELAMALAFGIDIGFFIYKNKKIKEAEQGHLVEDMEISEKASGSISKTAETNENQSL